MNENLIVMKVASKSCEHFEQFRPNKSIFIGKNQECKQCSTGKDNLWLCLTRECQEFHCSRNHFAHLQHHFQQSKRRKGFHCIFVNVLTAEIICLSCKIYIPDEAQHIQAVESPIKADGSKINNAYKLRTKVLPILNQLGNVKMVGPIQNSQAHRKVNSWSVGIFGDRFNHATHSSFQFLSHCSFFRELVLKLNVSPQEPLLFEMQQVMKEIQEARLRAIRIDKLDQLVYKEKPHLLTYQRKDPFQILHFFLQKLHQSLSFYTVEDPIHNYQKDEWDLFYRKSQLKTQCPIYGSLQMKLRLTYFCQKCKIQDYALQSINFLKLPFPKKKRCVKDIEKELNQHRCSSPLKNRKKSLMNLLFKQETIPFTIHELIIDMMKRPLHKEKACESCKQSMKKGKIYFQTLPDYLIIQISRMGSEYSIDETLVQLDTQTLDFGAFTTERTKQIFYDFQTAMCIEKGYLYPVLARNSYNKQIQIFRNQNISYSERLNPYIICYKRRKSEKSLHKFAEITETLAKVQVNKKGFILPDFWLLQLKHGFEKALLNPFICKHNKLKPKILPKEINHILVSQTVYENLIESYQGTQYRNEVCAECSQDIERLMSRKTKQKQMIKYYDSIKTEIYCMMANEWLNKWSNFIYSKTSPSYIAKGYPLPGPIDNKSILQGNKCKAYLIKDKDFKIVNIYVWRFLKELYGGGTEIRYKWKKDGIVKLSEQLLQEIKENAYSLKKLFSPQILDSPMKQISTMEQSSSYIRQQQHEISSLEL